jgi:hypothetical protein
VKGGVADGSICNCHLDKVQQVWLQTEEEKDVRKNNSSIIRICTTIFVIIIFAFSRKLLAKIVRKSQKFLECQGRKNILTNLTILEVNRQNLSARRALCNKRTILVNTF